jgi:hypothetical protein
LALVVRGQIRVVFPVLMVEPQVLETFLPPVVVVVGTPLMVSEIFQA